MRMLTSANGTAHSDARRRCAFAQSAAPSRNGPCWPGGGRFVVLPGMPRAADDARQPGGIGKRGGLHVDDDPAGRRVGEARVRAEVRVDLRPAWPAPADRAPGRSRGRGGPDRDRCASRTASGCPRLRLLRRTIRVFSPTEAEAAGARSPRTRAGGRTPPPDRESSRSPLIARLGSGCSQSSSAPLRGNSTVGGSMPTLTNTGRAGRAALVEHQLVPALVRIVERSGAQRDLRRRTIRCRRG